MTVTHETRSEPATSRTFADRMLDIYNGGALALGISLGHRLRLFDDLARLGTATSEELAEAGGLEERYVREWLAAMVTGDIVEYDVATGRYALPPDRARFLTRRGEPENMAVPLQFIPLLARVEDDLVDCFRNGGGVPYARFERFHEVMAEMSSQTVVSVLFERILPLVPGLASRLQDGIEVVDIGCGRARALIAMASAYPNSHFVGIDLSDEAISVARARALRLGLRNVTLEVADAAELDPALRCDLATAFDAIHDQAQPERVLRGIRRALRDHGVFLMQEIATSSSLAENRGHPLGPFLYTLSFGHCMTVSLARDGAGLGTCWGRERAMEMLAEAGFTSAERHTLPHDFQNEFFVVRP